LLLVGGIALYKWKKKRTMVVPQVLDESDKKIMSLNTLSPDRE